MYIESRVTYSPPPTHTQTKHKHEHAHLTTSPQNHMYVYFSMHNCYDSPSLTPSFPRSHVLVAATSAITGTSILLAILNIVPFMCFALRPACSYCSYCGPASM